jgi:phosphatidylglycerol:prolipoprotein diacylglycerol transferase
MISMLPYIYFDETPFPMYSLLALLGILFVVIIGILKHKDLGLHKREILCLVLFATTGALLGAKLFGAIGQVVKHGAQAHFWTAENWRRIAGAGGVFYGGLLGAVGFAVLCTYVFRIARKNMFGFAPYALFAFQSVGRLACYCAGCCYGFTRADGTRFPVQLFEAGFCFSILLILLVLRPERRWPQVPLLPVGLIVYSAGRFVLEFFRGDANRGVWILSTSQWIAMVLIALSILWLKKSANHKEDTFNETKV